MCRHTAVDKSITPLHYSSVAGTMNVQIHCVDKSITSLHYSSLAGTMSVQTHCVDKSIISLHYSSLAGTVSVRTHCMDKSITSLHYSSLAGTVSVRTHCCGQVDYFPSLFLISRNSECADTLLCTSRFVPSSSPHEQKSLICTRTTEISE